MKIYRITPHSGNHRYAPLLFQHAPDAVNEALIRYTEVPRAGRGKARTYSRDRKPITYDEALSLLEKDEIVFVSGDDYMNHSSCYLLEQLNVA